MASGSAGYSDSAVLAGVPVVDKDSQGVLTVEADRDVTLEPKVALDPNDKSTLKVTWTSVSDKRSRDLWVSSTLCSEC